MHVLNKIAALAASATPARGAKDVELWKAWKQSPTETNLSALLSQVNPLVHREVNKWSGSLARPLLESEGKLLALEAFKTYDASKGAGLGTHVANQLQKMSRLSYSNQNIARLPENKMLMFHTYNIAHSQLSDSLGRAPTTDELADNLGWTIPHLTKFRTQIGRQEVLESGGAAGEAGTAALTAENEVDHTVDFIHHGLPPQQKAVFEHLTGYGGVPVLSNQQIMKKMDLTQGQYSYIKKQLIDHTESIVGGKK